MVNGGLPFKESDAKAVLSAMKKPVYFKGWLTEECKDLIRGLLKIRPQKRMSLSEIFAHSWMKPCRYRHFHKQGCGDEVAERSSGEKLLFLQRIKETPQTDVILIGENNDQIEEFQSPEDVFRFIMKSIKRYKEKETKAVNPREERREKYNKNAALKALEFTFVPKSPDQPRKLIPATPIVSIRHSEDLIPKPRPAVTRQTKQYLSINQSINQKLYSQKHSKHTVAKLPKTRMNCKKTNINLKFELTREEPEPVTNTTKLEKNASSSTDNLRTDMKQSIAAKDHKKLGAKCAKEIIFGSGYPKHLRFSTTPTIVNIGLTERNSTVQKIDFNLKQLQKLSSYKSQQNQELRLRAATVPPESHVLPDYSKKCTTKTFYSKSGIIPQNGKKIIPEDTYAVVHNSECTKVQNLFESLEQKNIRLLKTITDDLEMPEIERNPANNSMLQTQIHKSTLPLKAKNSVLITQGYDSLITGRGENVNKSYLPKDCFLRGDGNKREKSPVKSIVWPTFEQCRITSGQPVAACMGQNYFTPSNKTVKTNGENVNSNNKRQPQKKHNCLHCNLDSPTSKGKILYKRRQASKNACYDALLHYPQTWMLRNNKMPAPSCAHKSTLINKIVQSPPADLRVINGKTYK